MEAIYFGSAGRRATGPFKEDGPWIGADLENGLCVARPVARPVAAPLRAQLRPSCGPVAAPLRPRCCRPTLSFPCSDAVPPALLRLARAAVAPFSPGYLA